MCESLLKQVPILEFITNNALYFLQSDSSHEWLFKDLTVSLLFNERVHNILGSFVQSLFQIPKVLL